MKKYVRLLKIKSLLVLILLLITTYSAKATNSTGDNYVIITGQITNTEHGNPLEEHTVYIESEQLTFSTSYYFKVLETDEDGFFYDTISTNIEYGSFEVYTFDYEGNKSSEILHFRFMDISNNNTFLVNFHIFMPLQTPVLQARFKFIKKITGDKFRFKFVDETQHENIKNWFWEFGDGTNSSLPNPEHLFTKYGMYKVNLTVVAEIDGIDEMSTISKYVFIPRISYYHIGGHCLVNQFPIDKGYACLYRIDEDEVLIPFDTVALNDTLGYYYFYQVPEGIYCVKTQPDVTSEFYGTMMPTYYGDTEYWNKATRIINNHTDFEYHINLVTGSGIPTGNGKIAGKVTFTNGDRDGNAYSSVGVAIYILDALNNPMSCQYTDENSSFCFENMALGTYWIYPEVAGFNLTKEIIELTELIPVIQDVDIYINTDAVYLIFPDSEDMKDNFISQPYPNPASNHFSFEINAKNDKEISMDIVNLQGKVVISKILNLHSGLTKNTIQTSSLTPGIYFLRLNANGITNERKIIINH